MTRLWGSQFITSLLLRKLYLLYILSVLIGQVLQRGSRGLFLRWVQWELPPLSSQGCECKVRFRGLGRKLGTVRHKRLLLLLQCRTWDQCQYGKCRGQERAQRLRKRDLHVTTVGDPFPRRSLRNGSRNLVHQYPRQIECQKDQNCSWASQRLHRFQYKGLSSSQQHPNKQGDRCRFWVVKN